MERPANPVLDKVRARGWISPDERDLLVAYLATMLTRVPRLRALRETIAPQALKESFDDYRSLIRMRVQQGLLSVADGQAHIHEADRFEEQCARSLPEFVSDQIKCPWPTEQILDLVGGMAWRFVGTKGPAYFITSDDPGSFFHGFGLKHPNAELIFPISSEVGLHASWQCNPWPGVRPINQWLVKEFNRRIAVGASRFVYSRDRAEWLPSVLANRVEQLSRIEW